MTTRERTMMEKQLADYLRHAFLRGAAAVERGEVSEDLGKRSTEARAWADALAAGEAARTHQAREDAR